MKINMIVTLLTELEGSLKKQYNVFIASASFEERSLSAMRAIENIDFDKKIVSVSSAHVELFPENLQEFEQKGFIQIKNFNTDQVVSVTNFIIEINKSIKENADASFLVDISTFTRQTLLILLRVLRTILTDKNKLQFLYTPAKEYSIGLTYDEKWLSKGLLEVNSVFGYSGIIRPSRPYHLIILMGFEVERASSLINIYEPTKISIGYAKRSDSITEENYLINKKKFDELLDEFPFAESFEFSCINVEEIKTEILKQTKKYKNYNVVISPMNNKISTVSCALAAFENDEIQLAIAVPAVYNHENYSTPGDKCYIIDVPGLIKGS